MSTRGLSLLEVVLAIALLSLLYTSVSMLLIEVHTIGRALEQSQEDGPWGKPVDPLMPPGSTDHPVEAEFPTRPETGEQVTAHPTSWLFDQQEPAGTLVEFRMGDRSVFRYEADE